MKNSKDQGKLNKILQYFDHDSEEEEEQSDNDQNPRSRNSAGGDYANNHLEIDKYSQQEEEEEQQDNQKESQHSFGDYQQNTNNRQNEKDLKIEEIHNSDNEEYYPNNNEEQQQEHEEKIENSPKFASKEEEEDDNKINEDEIRCNENISKDNISPNMNIKDKKEQTNNNSDNINNSDDNSQNQNDSETESKTQKELIREEMRKREEALRAELKLKEEALREGLRRQKAQEQLERELSLKQTEIQTQTKLSENDKSLSKPDPSKRASILLRSKQEELKLIKTTANKDKTVFDEFNEELLKDKYNIDEKAYDELMQKDMITSKNVNSYFKPTLYNDTTQFKFKPEINKNSKKIMMNKHNQSKTLEFSSRSKSPVELTLYEDALIRKKKKENLELNTEINIKLNASKSKISNNSHKIAIGKMEKTIEQAVKKFSMNGTLTFLNVAQVLTELHIFRELLKTPGKGDKANDMRNTLNLKEDINKVKDYEKRKREEIIFLEQIWICLNPKNEDVIKSEIFKEFLKILFSPVESSVKEIASILRPFLQAALFLNNNTNKKNDSSNLVKSGIISPITDQLLSSQDVWSLETLVKHFLLLKQNIIAYKSIKHYSHELQKELIEYQKKMTFKPKVENSKIRVKIFEKKLPTFQERERLRSLALQELKKEAEKAELEQCTFKPQININYNNTNSFADQDQTPIYDKLYKIHKDLMRKKEQQSTEKKKEMKDKEMEGCTFKPKVYNNRNLNKSFDVIELPKGFNEHVDHVRRGIIENYRKKYMIEKKPVGENYEKVKRKTIKPFNITDMRKMEEKEYREEIKNKTGVYPDEEDNEDDDEEYFTVQIKIPSGKKVTINVYANDDPEETAENFCRTYQLKEDTKRRLVANIINFQKTYLKQQAKEEEEEENREDY